MKERKRGRRYSRPKIKRPRVRLQLRVLRSESHRPFPIRASAESGSIVTRTKDQSHARNEFCSSLDETVLTESRAAIGVELLRGGKFGRKYCQTAVAIVLSDYFFLFGNNVYLETQLAILSSFCLFIFLRLPKLRRNCRTICRQYYDRIVRQHESGREPFNVSSRYVTYIPRRCSAVAHAHLGSWLQSARRHTLNTIPGALLNAARAFISCLNGWMSTKEPGRFARVSTYISVMKPVRNTTFSGCEPRDVKTRDEIFREE